MFIEEHNIILLLPIQLLHYIKYKQVQFSFCTIYLNIFTIALCNTKQVLIFGIQLNKTWVKYF